jgi:hypothetical protein
MVVAGCGTRRRGCSWWWWCVVLLVVAVVGGVAVQFVFVVVIGGGGVRGGVHAWVSHMLCGHAGLAWWLVVHAGDRLCVLVTWLWPVVVNVVVTVGGRRGCSWCVRLVI